MTKRLFIAIDFPEEVKKQISQLVEELKKKYPEIRWEKEENLHLTLKFLGWTDKAEEITKGMNQAASGIKPFWFQPTAIGYFLRDSLIVWLGAQTQEGLFSLVENLEEEMTKIGFFKEKRPFAVHITLGRRRQASPIVLWRQTAQELQKTKIPQFEKFKVENIVLMESHLTPQGSIYSPLEWQSLLC